MIYMIYNVFWCLKKGGGAIPLLLLLIFWKYIHLYVIRNLFHRLIFLKVGSILKGLKIKLGWLCFKISYDSGVVLYTYKRSHPNWLSVRHL